MISCYLNKYMLYNSQVSCKKVRILMQESEILKLANVPEHSLYFMQAVSGGSFFLQDNYLCFSANNWLTIIGYPLKGEYNDNDFLQAKDKAVKAVQAINCYTVAPFLPKVLEKHIEEKDDFYILPLPAEIPRKLKNPIQKAKEKLRVELGTTFTAQHKRLFTEFMSRVPLNEKVRTLFSSTQYLFTQNISELYLLNAWDAENRLVATLLLDFAAHDFTSYILGAHSKSFYSPHAHDLLFEQMIKISEEKNKKYIHLGLGVNEGIKKFKLKWNAQKAQSFVMASWKEDTAQDGLKYHTQTILNTLTDKEQAQEIFDFIGKSKHEMFAQLPKQKNYAMIWEVKKNNKISWIGGSAHFFCYSFENSFKRLFNQVDTVLFEGPLDSDTLKLVSENGRDINEEHQPLFQFFTKEEIEKLTIMVNGKEGFFYKLLNMESKNKLDIEWYLKNTRAWTALFTLWTTYLERNGWRQSVDMEGWHLAHDMGKTVVAMESLEEQLASLNSVPPQRVVKYFQNCDKWPSMIKANVKSYLAGDLMGVMGTSAEFPTRTKTIISMRDERFRQRMRPFMEAGGAAVFVGTAHMLNLQNMLKEDGFEVRKLSYI